MRFFMVCQLLLILLFHDISAHTAWPLLTDRHTRPIMTSLCFLYFLIHHAKKGANYCLSFFVLFCFVCSLLAIVGPWHRDKSRCINSSLKDKSGDIFLIIKISHEKTKTHRKIDSILASIAFEAKVWYSLFLCAIDLDLK